MEKERRHEYETVWVDDEGNELEEPPDDEPAPARDRRPNGKKSQQKRPQQRQTRATRPPTPPSWRRSIKRSLMLGALMVVVVYLFNSKAKGSARIASSVGLAVLYTALFVPFTYYLDRFTYRRWERNQPTKKR